MKKFLKIMQTISICVVSLMMESWPAKIVAILLCVALGACAYAEGLFYGKD